MGVAGEMQPSTPACVQPLKSGLTLFLVVFIGKSILDSAALTPAFHSDMI